MSFHIFEHAEELIADVWEAEVPVYAPHEGALSESVYQDDKVISETIRVLAELVYYSKRADKGGHAGATDWIKGNFTGENKDRYLPGLEKILQAHFPDLIQGTVWALPDTVAAAQRQAAAGRQTLFSMGHAPHRKRDMLNYFYIQDYTDIPAPPSLEALMSACGIGENDRPSNHAYLMQTYSRAAVRLERFIALSHLMIAGAQSETIINRATLEREFQLQAKIKELKANYLAEYCTMRLGFVKRHKGLEMFQRLNQFTGYDRKHHLALSAIEDRLQVGTEQYPSIVNATHKTQRMFMVLGQVLLGGFLATEVVKSLSEWAAVYFHRNPYAFLTELFKLGPAAGPDALSDLLDKFYHFEMISVYGSLLTVTAVIATALYYRTRSKTLNAPSESHGHRH